MKNKEEVDSLVKAIMTGKLTRYFYGEGLCEISLTHEERVEYLTRICDQYVNGYQADDLSESLEELICGHAPYRYKHIGTGKLGRTTLPVLPEKIWGLF